MKKRIVKKKTSEIVKCEIPEKRCVKKEFKIIPGKLLVSNTSSLTIVEKRVHRLGLTHLALKNAKNAFCELRHSI